MSTKLFYDDEFDALSQTISNSEKEFKEVAALLFPHLKPTSQYARLKNCLNPLSDERLSFGQIIAMCNFCGNFDALAFMADECKHNRPTPKDPETKLAELMREFVDMGKRLERTGEEIKRLSQSPLVVVAGGKGGA